VREFLAERDYEGFCLDKYAEDIHYVSVNTLQVSRCVGQDNSPETSGT
jgi:hypothetical protein